MGSQHPWYPGALFTPHWSRVMERSASSPISAYGVAMLSHFGGVWVLLLPSPWMRLCPRGHRMGESWEWVGRELKAHLKPWNGFLEEPGLGCPSAGGIPASPSGIPHHSAPRCRLHPLPPPAARRWDPVSSAVQWEPMELAGGSPWGLSGDPHTEEPLVERTRAPQSQPRGCRSNGSAGKPDSPSQALIIPALVTERECGAPNLGIIPPQPLSFGSCPM